MDMAMQASLKGVVVGFLMLIVSSCFAIDGKSKAAVKIIPQQSGSSGNLDVQISKQATVKCVNWVVDANKQIGRTKVIDRFNSSLKALSQTCTKLPKTFKEAAKLSLEAKGEQILAPLQQVSAPYFSSICLEGELMQAAKGLPHLCLGSDFIDGQYMSILPNIDAAVYLFVKSLEQELNASESPSSANQRFLLNLLLSAAHNREVGWEKSK